MADHIDMSIAETAPVLRPGDSGDWVHYLQQMLETANHRLPRIDSSFNHATEQAVREFQAWVPIPVTGVVDRATWEALIRNANTLEWADTVKGESVGAADADDAKLETGEEVGRKGWRRLNLSCNVLNFRHRPFPDSSAYVRFTTSENGNEVASDERADVVNGTVRLHQVWVPQDGEFHLWVRSHQPAPTGGTIGDIYGMKHYVCKGNDLHFEARQSTGETRTGTWEQARSSGWVRGESLEAGIDFDIFISPSFGATITTEDSSESSYGSSESYTFTFGGDGLEVTLE
jgi:hypothetical protein